MPVEGGRTSAVNPRNARRSASRDQPARKERPGFGWVLSAVLHTAVLGALLFWLDHSGTVQIVAAGPGTGGEGGGGSIEVGVADPSSILGFAKPQPAAFIGNETSPVNNAKLERAKSEDTADEAVLTPPRPDKSD